MESSDRAPVATGRNGGLLLAVGAAVLFALKGTLTKFAYGEGLGVTALLTLRFALSTPLLWLSLLAFGKDSDGSGKLDRRSLVGCAIAGALFGAANLADFQALSLLDVSIERTILFTYPAFVVAFDALTSRRWPHRRHLLAFVITYLGLAIVLGIIGGEGVAFNGSWEGVVWALGAACTFGVYLTFNQPLIRQLGTLRYTALSQSANFILIAIYFLSTRPLSDLATTRAGWLEIAAIAIACTVVPLLLLYESIKRIGSVVASSVAMLAPVFAIAIAFVLLGERLAPLQLLGAAIVFAGVFTIRQQPS